MVPCYSSWYRTFAHDKIATNYLANSCQISLEWKKKSKVLARLFARRIGSWIENDDMRVWYTDCLLAANV